MEYEAYVRMEGIIRADGSVQIQRVTKSFPDESRLESAYSLATEVKLRAATIGSHLSPKAEIWVIFYPRSLEGNLVLIFARQSDDLLPGTEQRALYLNTKLN